METRAGAVAGVSAAAGQKKAANSNIAADRITSRGERNFFSTLNCFQFDITYMIENQPFTIGTKAPAL
jgi:uncharacterized protein YcfJ